MRALLRNCSQKCKIRHPIFYIFPYILAASAGMFFFCGKISEGWVIFWGCPKKCQWFPRSGPKNSGKSAHENSRNTKKDEFQKNVWKQYPFPAKNSKVCLKWPQWPKWPKSCLGDGLQIAISEIFSVFQKNVWKQYPFTIEKTMSAQNCQNHQKNAPGLKFSPVRGHNYRGKYRKIT